MMVFKSIKMGALISAAIVACCGTASAATFMFFTDRASFDAAATGTVVEDFNGVRQGFAGNSTGNVVGTQTTMDVIGPGDNSFFGITGTGFLELDVDGAGQDLGSYAFNTGPINGFALDLISDNNSTPNFDGAEVGVSFGGSSWLITDILGLTDSSSGATIGSTTIGASFVGIISDMQFSGFSIISGADVAPNVSAGSSENVWIDNLVLATDVTPVPLPAALPLLLGGLGILGLAGWRRRNSV